MVAEGGRSTIILTPPQANAKNVVAVGDRQIFRQHCRFKARGMAKGADGNWQGPAKPKAPPVWEKSGGLWLFGDKGKGASKGGGKGK